MLINYHVQTLQFEAISRAALSTVDVVAKRKNYLQCTNKRQQTDESQTHGKL